VSLELLLWGRLEETVAKSLTTVNENARRIVATAITSVEFDPVPLVAI
jgi:hypothetical protein